MVRGGLAMGCSLVAPVACMSCLLSMVRWGHGAGTAVHRDCGHTWRIEGNSKATSSPQVPLRTRCGPWRAGDGLFPGGPGSLDILLGVHGAVGSWVVMSIGRMASVRREGLSKQDLKKRERGRRLR